MSTWIWPALHCQVCIPALSKLLGGQKGNPHTEAFHSRDLACCPSFSRLPQVAAGVILLQSPGLGAHCKPRLTTPHLGSPRPQFSPHLDEAGGCLH